jgi:hypothetical protein
VIEVILDELPEPEPFKGPRKGLPSDHAKHAPGDRNFLIPRLVSEDDVGLYTDLRRLMPTLTKRQQEIFSALFEHDMGIEAVSQEFDMSPQLVIYHRNEIAHKLQPLRSV